ncbi:MAG: hypothetical protein EPO61_02930 [Nitrospirae bacterium]|nr:MAG: hypothetical protein EPO61_02930 [Nitrospirota bacterium]
MDQDLSRLRRFALTVGVILIVYIASGIELPNKPTVIVFGTPLDVTKPKFFELGLLLISLYATLRYWYHSWIQNPSPSRIRRRLRRGEFGLVRFVKDENELTNMIRRYLPGMEQKFTIRTSTRAEASGLFQVCKVEGKELLQIPWKTRLWSVIDNLDYTAPLWINGIGIILFLLTKAFAAP